MTNRDKHLANVRANMTRGDHNTVPVTNDTQSDVVEAGWQKAVAETNRLQRELDITNADHIALWLEHNTIADEPMNQCSSWLACRIVEAHEAALASTEDSDAVLEEQAAKRIYEHWSFGTWFKGDKPAWVEGGNSEAQVLARTFAHAAISKGDNA